MVPTHRFFGMHFAKVFARVAHTACAARTSFPHFLISKFAN